MEKRASWLELFYDVAFVALVAQLTYLASEYHHTLTDFLNIATIAYAVFIAWWATTANRNLQPVESTYDKLFIQLQMVGAFAMSLTMAPVFEGQYFGFFATLAALRLLQSGMIIKMYALHPETRPTTYNILEGFFVGSALWALSAVLPAPYHFVAAFMALAVDVLVPLTRGKGNTKRYLNVHHLQERLGLFLMLVIGESMIVVALASSAAPGLFANGSIVVSGIGLMIALWWLYFDYSDRYSGTRPRHLFAFLHAHGLLYVSIVLVSVGYKMMLDGEYTIVAYSFCIAGMAGIILMIGAVRAALHKLTWRNAGLATLLITGGAVISIIGFVSGQYLLALGVLTLLFLITAYVDQTQNQHGRTTRLLTGTTPPSAVQ